MEEVRVTWNPETEKTFLSILEVIPDMIRGIAETRVAKRAEANNGISSKYHARAVSAVGHAAQHGHALAHRCRH